MSGATSLDVILAGGEGKRLFPITRDRAKPAAPFGGKYRIIDFVLNNHYNSGSRDMLVLMQHQPVSLLRHIDHAWAPVFKQRRKKFIKIVKPEHGNYKGTADAVYQNLERIEAGNPRIVTVFGGDHIYLMDISQMKAFHLDHHADLTIAATPVRKELATGDSGLGVIVANEKGDVVKFEEKVPNPTEILGMPGYCWASMGNYIFTPNVLFAALRQDAEKQHVSFDYKELVVANPDIYTFHDFGFNVIPMLLREGKKSKMYDFTKNNPASMPNTGYWRDVGTLDQFIEANMDLTGDNPVLIIDNPGWPIVTYDESHGKPVEGAGFARGSVLANGVSIEESHLVRCILSYSTHIGKGSEAHHSIFMGGNKIGKNVVLRDVVVDKGVHIPDSTRIGVSREDDATRGFVFSPGGYVIIPRNYQFK